MKKRLKYHFEPKKGWINDPNGLVWFKGQYHAFFQHYPYAPKWGQMHWGHAVSDDLVHWTELPIALFPDQNYENSGGCFSGSAVVKDDVLYLFYTSVGNELNQTQSLATSVDGITFVKYEKNPIISECPINNKGDFRDPKVTKIGEKYYMVCGSGIGNCGKILLFSSENLFDWTYIGILFEGEEYGKVLECPDFFPIGDKYMLMFSQMGKTFGSTMFVYGDFDGKRFTPETFESPEFGTSIRCFVPEMGPHFYAPQTFKDNKNRRIMIAWMYSWDKKPDENAIYTGSLTIPRELTVNNGRLYSYPVAEACSLLSDSDKDVEILENIVNIYADNQIQSSYHGEINDVKILRDENTIEVFINKGINNMSLNI